MEELTATILSLISHQRLGIFFTLKWSELEM
ncbi:hypothetical protein CTO_1013 [Chlamydia trachomatis A2497]|uniref:Uncharacterized protein n=1 Tax=Chlamydia trachomatis serovar A (strain A2497) TaxID=580047 RepID=G4NPN7_CHLT4|nr:hypothetical protein CTO_1013 [Chlamydia trachomatis A2497]